VTCTALQERGATIIYATHIFDGMENWVTHVAYMENGKLIKGKENAKVLDVELSCWYIAAANLDPNITKDPQQPQHPTFLLLLLCFGTSLEKMHLASQHECHLQWMLEYVIMHWPLSAGL
jgi:energy-coupling factor transporter ATP-binding protein EcfA2